MSHHTTPAPPRGYKLLAWEGVGLFVPQRWDLGRREGDRRRGLFRVDSAAGVIVQARWWPIARAISVDAVVAQHAEAVGTGEGSLEFERLAEAALPAGPGQLMEAFTARNAQGNGECIVVGVDPAVKRAALLRVLVEGGRPDPRVIMDMLRGVRLQRLEDGRDWGMLDFTVRSPPGYELTTASLKAGVCYLGFARRGRRLALRRFSAADAVVGVENPTVEDLERWLPMAYAAEFHDMRYEMKRLADGQGRPMLRLTGRRRLLAPLEARWLIPRHRRVPGRIDVIWDPDANKIFCIEAHKPRPEIEDDIIAFGASARATLAGDDEAVSEPEDGREGGESNARLRMLRARVALADDVRFHASDSGRVVIDYRAAPTAGVRLLKVLGARLDSGGPRDRHVELDMIGSLVWRRGAEGARVGEIVEAVRRRFRISYREAEQSVVEFLRGLGQRGWVKMDWPRD